MQLTKNKTWFIFSLPTIIKKYKVAINQYTLSATKLLQFTVISIVLSSCNTPSLPLCLAPAI
jgi:hypothetical protein